MTRKLKSSVVIKDVNPEVCFALNLADDNDQFNKFEGVACRFLKLISSQKSDTEIIKSVMEEFEGCTQAQVETDYKDFVSHIERLNLLA